MRFLILEKFRNGRLTTAVAGRYGGGWRATGVGNAKAGGKNPTNIEYARSVSFARGVLITYMVGRRKKKQNEPPDGGRSEIFDSEILVGTMGVQFIRGIHGPEYIYETPLPTTANEQNGRAGNTTNVPGAPTLPVRAANVRSNRKRKSVPVGLPVLRLFSFLRPTRSLCRSPRLHNRSCKSFFRPANVYDCR